RGDPPGSKVGSRRRRPALNAESKVIRPQLPVGKVRLMSKQVRLTQPLVRDNGTLRPASWDEALDRAAAGFAASRQRAGRKSLGMFRSSKATNEMNYMAQKFTR